MKALAMRLSILALLLLAPAFVPKPAEGYSPARPVCLFDEGSVAVSEECLQRMSEVAAAWHYIVRSNLWESRLPDSLITPLTRNVLITERRRLEVVGGAYDGLSDSESLNLGMQRAIAVAAILAGLGVPRDLISLRPSALLHAPGYAEQNRYAEVFWLGRADD